MSSFAKLNRSIWSAQYNKLIQSAKLEHFVRQSKEFLLRNCYTIVNINGVNFEEFADKHRFVKPNDLRGKNLMDHCAKSLLEQLKPHILLSYGFADQFSFVFNRSSDFCGRNLTDILSVVVSSFASHYVFNWRTYFEEQLKYAPAFKGSTLLLPTEESLISYLLTKQHECYITNLNSTLYAALVGRHRSYESDASGACKLIEHLNGNDSGVGQEADSARTNARRPLSNEDALNLIETEIDSISKINEFLFKEYNINYNNEPELFRKGCLIAFDAKTDQLNSYHLKLSGKFLDSLLSENRVQSKTASQIVAKGAVQQAGDGKRANANQSDDLADNQSSDQSGDQSSKKLKTVC